MQRLRKSTEVIELTARGKAVDKADATALNRSVKALDPAGESDEGAALETGSALPELRWEDEALETIKQIHQSRSRFFFSGSCGNPASSK